MTGCVPFVTSQLTAVNFPGRVVGILAITALLPGCGAGIAECTLDADCDQGMACEVSQCVQVCSSDANCDDDEACLRGLTTETRVCRVDSGADAAAVRSVFAVVRDASSGEACMTRHPGADLSFVVLETPDGEVVGWARAIKSGVITEDNDFSTVAHMDGDRPQWGADSCPDFELDHVVALGCSGFLAVEFLDAEQAQVGARSGEHRLRVGEYGAQCGGSDSDRYEVLLCPGIENMDDIPDGCTVSVGVGQGERAFEI